MKWLKMPKWWYASLLLCGLLPAFGLALFNMDREYNFNVMDKVSWMVFLAFTYISCLIILILLAKIMGKTRVKLNFQNIKRGEGTLL